MPSLGYFTLPIGEELSSQTLVHVHTLIPDLAPGLVLYQCVWEPTESGTALVGALESVMQIGLRRKELARGEETVFQGSYTRVRQPEIRVGKYTKDFGCGFYCTQLREQAERWASRYPTPVVNVYTSQITTDLRVLEFEMMTEGWLDFIANCRGGVPHQYDIVIGPMADDKVYDHVNAFLSGEITREQFWSHAKFKRPTHQIVFCTERSLQALTYVSSKEVRT